MDEEIVVTGSEVAEAQSAYSLRFQLGLIALTTVALTLALALLPLFAVTFLFLAEALRQRLGSSTPVNTLGPLLLATLAAWAVVYLAHDRIGAIGNTRAMALTSQRVRLLCEEPLPADARFVELRLKGYPSDVGWLFIENGRLRFIGEVIQLKAERGALSGPVRRLPSLGGLLSAYVEAGTKRQGRLRLLERTDIVRLSDAATLAPALAGWLQRWLDDAPPE